MEYSPLYKMTSHALIFTAESMAILKATEIIVHNNFSEAYIFSDSLSVIQAISQPSLMGVCNEVVLLIRRNLFEAQAKGIQTEIIWIPAHKGIEGNETVDSLAKVAIRHGINFEDGIPYRDCYRKIKENAKFRFSAFLERWKLIKENVYFRRFYENLNKTWFNDYKNFSRRVITTVNRIRSNHHNLKAFLAKINIVNSTSCSCGYHSENIDHVL
jgi:ribonuclease HI